MLLVCFSHTLMAAAGATLLEARCLKQRSSNMPRLHLLRAAECNN
jgi:hypothetical protein